MRIDPTEIIHESDRALTIKWSDDRTSNYTAAALRRSCPCATCVNEWTGEKILKDESVEDELTFNAPQLVGRYALTFRFSDGHDTGIYSFEYLRDLSEPPAVAGG